MITKVNITVINCRIEIVNYSISLSKNMINIRTIKGIRKCVFSFNFRIIQQLEIITYNKGSEVQCDVSYMYMHTICIYDNVFKIYIHYHIQHNPLGINTLVKQLNRHKTKTKKAKYFLSYKGIYTQGIVLNVNTNLTNDQESLSLFYFKILKKLEGRSRTKPKEMKEVNSCNVKV